jgi:opacity protein-like surface antigen
MKLIKLAAASTLVACLSSVSAFALDAVVKNKTEKHDVTVDSSDKGRFYVGFEGGVSVPAMKAFKNKETKARVSMKRSPLYTGLIGYEFAPGMYLEFSASSQPNFGVGIKLPDNKGFGRTKAAAKVYMLNLAYDLMEVGGITPYVVLGAGMAKVTVKEKEILHPQYPAAWNIISMKTVRRSSNSFAWQAGLGAAYKVTDNLRLTASAKLQVINNVKMHYLSLNKDTGKPTDRGTMKKKIGTGEFALGFTYALPF